MGHYAENIFEIEVQGLKIDVSEHVSNDKQVLRLSFSDNRKPLIIAPAKTCNGEIWTSIPLGRQKEAEEFGKEISKHLE